MVLDVVTEQEVLQVTPPAVKGLSGAVFAPSPPWCRDETPGEESASFVWLSLRTSLFSTVETVLTPQLFSLAAVILVLKTAPSHSDTL